MRFPRGKSIIATIRTLYGNDTVRNVRKLEKTDYRLRKCYLDLKFLQHCQNNQTVSTAAVNFDYLRRKFRVKN